MPHYYNILKCEVHLGKVENAKRISIILTQ